jgi:hypothetical protein
MTNKMNIKCRVACGRCGGSGRYYFGRMDSAACYGCNGRGVVLMSRAQCERAEALRAKADRDFAAYREQERIDTERADRAYYAACDAIAAGGMGGARTYWRAHATDRVALIGLVAALRDEAIPGTSEAARYDAANAILADMSRRMPDHYR